MNLLMRFLLIIFLLPSLSFAQNNTQTLRGTIVDKHSQAPIIGATVQIASLQLAAMTDSLGNYSISMLPPDRYEVKVTFMGYKTIVLPNVVVTSGKEIILDLAMEEELNQLSEVTVKGTNKGGTINKLASVSARTFSMEEVNRYAGGRSDPAR
jgi:hypothetical protein